MSEFLRARQVAEARTPLKAMRSDRRLIGGPTISEASPSRPGASHTCCEFLSDGDIVRRIATNAVAHRLEPDWKLCPVESVSSAPSRAESPPVEPETNASRCTRRSELRIG